MNTITLDKLPINTLGKIFNINCSETIKRRLLDLGLIKGTVIKSVLKSPLGSPIAYEFRNCVIALRQSDTKCICIEII